MRNQSGWAGTAVVLMLSIAMIGCGGSRKPQDGGEKKFTIGMSQCNLNEPWRKQMDADLKAAAAKHPQIVLRVQDAQNNSDRQRSHVEEFVAAGVDLIIISPKETDPLTQPVAEAYDAGIPVIVIDRGVRGDKYTTFIGADNVKIGKAAAEWIANHIDDDGKIVELKGLMTSDPGRDRHNGFREGLGGKGNVIAEADTQWQQENANKEMESALGRFSDIDVVYAHNDPGAYGAYLAAVQAGRADDILFVGIDGLPHEGQRYVREGILDATFLYPTGGEEAIDLALKILAGEEVPKKVTLKSRLFTKDNIESGGEELE